MRSNASLSVVFLMLAGCVSSGGYGNFPSQTAAPYAGARDMSDDPYAAEPEPQPRRLRSETPYSDAPRIEANAGPGASYDRPGEAFGVPAEPAQDPTAGMPGPRGTSGRDATEQRYDEVGYAGVRGVAGGDANGGAVVAVARVPAGSFVEITALDTGKTIVALVTGTMEAGADHPIDLSPGAARQLGASGSTIPVRVRKVNASPPDQAALRAGQPATERPETPPVLLTALRKHLPGGASASTTPYRPAVPARGAAPGRSPTPSGSGYYVQVGAFSNAANAQNLARSLGGFVRQGSGLQKVQLGPFRSAGEAAAARARVAGQGYPDARVFTQN
jgi:rare lipoprotein A